MTAAEVTAASFLVHPEKPQNEKYDDDEADDIDDVVHKRSSLIKTHGARYGGQRWYDHRLAWELPLNFLPSSGTMGEATVNVVIQ